MNAFLRRITPICAAASVAVILAVASLTLALSQQAAGGYYTVVLTGGQQQWTAQISARSTLRPLSVGQEVDARVWRDTVMQITSNGWTATTYANPRASSFAARWILAMVAAAFVVTLAITGLLAAGAIRGKSAGA